MKNEQQNHPLHGVGLKNLLTELVEHYGWEILAEQLNVNCFKLNPSINSSHKFLHKTTWAREKLEAFYLYKFKQFPLPDDEQHSFSPRNRSVDSTPLSELPAEIELDAPEFFDDPITGPVFPSKKAVQATRSQTKASPNIESRQSKSSSENNAGDAAPDKTVSKPASQSSERDPWAKWRE